jgi:hypothetical protein
MNVFSGSFSPIVIAVIFLVFGVSLSIVQICCGFALQRGGYLVSREEDPFLYWCGYFCSTIPFLLIGIVILCLG